MIFYHSISKWLRPFSGCCAVWFAGFWRWCR